MTAWTEQSYHKHHVNCTWILMLHCDDFWEEPVDNKKEEEDAFLHDLQSCFLGRTFHFVAHFHLHVEPPWKDPVGGII